MAYTGFNKLQAQIASKPGMNAADAGAIAAAAGRSKYGAQAFNHAAASGTKLKGKPMKKKTRDAVAAFAKRNA